MRLLFLDTKANNPNRYISRAIYDALCRQPVLQQVVWADYADALALACRQAFDAFLAFDGEEADNPVVRRLCHLIPRRAIWFTEDPYEFQRNQAAAARFDVIFTNDAATVARYPGQALHLPLAADRDRHFQPITDRPPLYDLFFAGSAWPNRLAFLKRLRQARPNLRCKIILVSNPALAPHIQAWQGQFAFSRGVAIRDFCRLANRSLLTLTLPRRFATSAAGFDAASDTPGPRLFEAAAAGSCQLVDAETTPMAADLFDPVSHFRPFTDFDACLAHIDRLLAQPAEARSMALAAQRVTRDRHLYDHRVADIVSRLIDCAPAVIASEPHRQRKVLFLTHNIVEHGHFGGSELYLEEARRHLKGVDSWVLVADHRSAPICNYLLYGPTGGIVEHFTLGTAVQPGDLLHTELEDIFQSILERYGFDLVHFNHIMRFPFSLPILAKAFGVRTVYSLHDYYPICENFNLLGTEGKYCDIPSRPPGACDACLVRTRGLPVGSQARRLAFLRRSFDALDAVLVGSRTSADIFTALFPHLGDRITLLPPPIVATGQRGRPIGADDRLHVGLPGNFVRAKGADIALDLFQRCCGQPLVFHIFGRIDTEFDAAFDHLPSETVIRHGAYTGGNVPAAFTDCDVALFLSPWPETYCIALSEAQALGIVPVVTDLGAQGERVRDGIDGLKVPVGDVDAAAAALERLQDRDWLRQLAAALPRQPGISGMGFAAALDEFYASLLKEQAFWGGVLEPSRHFALDELGVVLASPRWSEAALPALPPQPSVGMREKLAFLRGKFTTTLRGQGVGYAVRRTVAWITFRLQRRLGWLR